MKHFIALAALIAPAAAFAADQVVLESEVLVERVKQAPDGKQVTVFEPPKVVVPGDKLMFVLSYKNVSTQPARTFVVTNPVPTAVAYSGAETKGEAVSVDQGKTWGELHQLKVTAPDGSVRKASPADVTHVRWSFAQPIPAGAAGKIRFRGTVK